MLLVEEEFIQARYVRILLEEMGCDVVGPVASVHETLQLVSKMLPDAALLDIQLGGLNLRDRLLRASSDRVFPSQL